MALAINAAIPVPGDCPPHPDRLPAAATGADVARWLEEQFAAIARWSLAHGVAVWVAAVVLAVSALVLAMPPKVDSNLLNLLPDSDPTVRAIKRINDEEGGLNVLSLSFEADDPAALDPVLDEIVRKLEALPDIEFALHEVDPGLARHIALLQLDPGELSELVVRMKGGLALGPAMNPMVAQRLLDMGPTTEKIASANKTSLLGKADGKGRVIVRPRLPATDPAFATQIMTEVRGVLAEVAPEQRGVRLVWEGGAYRHTMEDVQGIAWDLYWTTFVSAGLVMLVLVLAFRSLRALVIVFPPLVIANAVTMLGVKWGLGTLNTYTSFGMAMLFGLGIEHAVHLAGRYRERRALGIPVDEAIVETWRHTGPPCLTSAATSVAGFFALVLAEFGGFRQLGLLLAGGLALCLIANIVLLPPALARFDRFAPPLLGTQVGSPSPSRSTYALAPWLAAGLVMVSALAFGLAMPRVGFEYDLSEMRRDGMAWDELSEEQRRMVKDAYSPVVATLAADDDPVARLTSVRSAIAEGRMPHVSGVVSLAGVLPPDQSSRNLQIRELVGMLDDPDLRYLPPPVVQALLPLKGLQIRDLTREDLPPGLLHLLGASNAAVNRLILVPKGNLWDVREARALAEEVHTVLPDVEVAGEHIGVASMFELILGDMPRIIAAGFLVITVLSWLDLRKPLWTLSAIVSLVGGMVWAVVAMWAFGIKFSTVNLTAIPILMGVAVDAVIHLTHRLQEEGPGGIRRALGTTGIAVAVGAATNIASFWALTMGSNRGVASLGWIVFIGLLTVTSMGTALLVSLWAAGWRITRRAPSQAG